MEGGSVGVDEAEADSGGGGGRAVGGEASGVECSGVARAGEGDAAAGDGVMVGDASAVVGGSGRKPGNKRGRREQHNKRKARRWAEERDREMM